MKRRTMTVTALTMATGAMAHEGHGMPGSSHWHAADALGFIVAIALVAVLVWWGGRGR